MDSKHSRLPTDKLVLVSASGFSKPAFELANRLNRRPVTPGEVTPGFVGEIVDNLTSVWVKMFNFTPRHVRLNLNENEFPSGAGEVSVTDQKCPTSLMAYWPVRLLISSQCAAECST